MNMQQSRFLVLLLLLFPHLFAQTRQPQEDAPLSIDEAVREAMERNLDLIAEKYNLSDRKSVV